MSSKDKPSKKAIREKKEKIVEDATFGLKNKNKSKKVQQFIQRVEKGVANSHGGAEAVCIFTWIVDVVHRFAGQGQGSQEGG